MKAQLLNRIVPRMAKDCNTTSDTPALPPLACLLPLSSDSSHKQCLHLEQQHRLPLLFIVHQGVPYWHLTSFGTCTYQQTLCRAVTNIQPPTLRCPSLLLHVWQSQCAGKPALTACVARGRQIGRQIDGWGRGSLLLPCTASASDGDIHISAVIKDTT